MSAERMSAFELQSASRNLGGCQVLFLAEAQKCGLEYEREKKLVGFT